MEAMGCNSGGSAPLCLSSGPVDRHATRRRLSDLARRIGTFDTSILPYEDCCTVFTPKHPRTKPRLKRGRGGREPPDIEGLVKEAYDGIERIKVNI